MNKFIRINEKDNVAVALSDLTTGMICTVDGIDVTLLADIPRGHKFALFPIGSGDKVIKYGDPIGIARCPIEAGCHVHTHNMRTSLSGEMEYTYNPKEQYNFFTNKSSGHHQFMGYLRESGRVGIRNEIWVIPTVGCVNNTAQKIAADAKVRFSSVSGIDDYIAFPHPYGCSQLGDDQENTRKILADLCMHPNAGGVLLLGLGCENSGVEEIKKYIKDFNKLNIRTLICQETDDEIERSLQLIGQLVERTSAEKRVPLPVSSLTVGVKCGGSDGLSGITANPVVGNFTDRLTSAGGSVIMTEVPEMFGAEHLLMNRCKDETVFLKTVDMINDFKNYFIRHDQPVYENPSPGNKDGGITTLEDKSLGCTQKSGTVPVMDVLAYGEQVKSSGLSLLYAPGNDLVASTALAASGAQIVLFTTGRGTPFASPVPTVKISSNSSLAEKKSSWIDFDAGRLVSSDCNLSISDCGSELFNLVLDVAQGKKVKSEEAGFHDMAIFKQNITL